MLPLLHAPPLLYGLHAGHRGGSGWSASKSLARRLLSLTSSVGAHAPASAPTRRARILFPCPSANLLVVNTTAGDRCIRFHETCALRRISRTRLDLPKTPRSSVTNIEGLFDVAAFDGGATAAATAATAGRDGGGDWGGASSSAMEGSLLDLVALPQASVVLGLVWGTAQVRTTVLFRKNKIK